jgi:hypothetical protein
MKSSTAADDVEQLQLGELHDAAVERIAGPDLSRIRRYHHVIPLRGVEIDHANRGEAVEGERQGSSGEEVGFVGQAKMELGYFAHRSRI